MRPVVKTLGTFNVLVRGTSLVQASSGARKIWELYKFMLTNRKHGFSPESIIDHLWESQDYKDPRGAMRHQMYRLREVLQEDHQDSEAWTVVFNNGQYSWNSRKEIDLDTEGFIYLVNQGDAFKSSEPDKALDCYRQAFAIYEGDYLQECETEYWVVAKRSYYRRQYVKLLNNTVSLLMTEGGYEEIIDLCQKAIEIDLYEESFHVNLIKAMISSGAKRQADDHYKHVNTVFRNGLGVGLSEKMLAVYDEYLKHQEDEKDADLSNLMVDGEEYRALYCEPEVFMTVYDLEQRRLERSDSDFSTCSLTLPETHGQNRYKLMNDLKNHLLRNLRQGDIMTAWNEGQIFLLLDGVGESDMKNVLNRVLDDPRFAGVLLGDLKL